MDLCLLRKGRIRLQLGMRCRIGPTQHRVARVSLRSLALVDRIQTREWGHDLVLEDVSEFRYGLTTSPSFPILANSPAMIMQSLPENLDQVVAGHVIDNIINVFFDYVSEHI